MKRPALTHILAILGLFFVAACTKKSSTPSKIETRQVRESAESSQDSAETVDRLDFIRYLDVGGRDLLGIHCLSSVPLEECTGLFSKIPEGFFKIRPELDKIFSTLNPEEFGPNCQWAALAFHDPVLVQKPAFINFPEFLPILQQKYTRLSKDEPRQFGDMLVFMHVFKEKMVVDERKVEFVTFEHPLHAAILLDDGFAFQKEGPHTPDLSVDTLEHITKVWEDHLSALPKKRWQVLELRLFRLSKL